MSKNILSLNIGKIDPVSRLGSGSVSKSDWFVAKENNSIKFVSNELITF